VSLDRVKARHKLLLMAVGAVALVLVGVMAGFAILLSGAVSTEATKQHFWITHRLLDVGLMLSVRASASDIRAPQLDAPQMIARGAACYRMHCAQCHGGPTMRPGDHATGLLPIPSNLVQTGREWPAEWLYFVTKRGVRMTGMPAWEYRLAEESLWSTTAFLKKLPLLTREAYMEVERQALSMPCPEAQDIPREPTPESSKVMLRQYGCHSCHVIEGVVGPVTRVGPPLSDWAQRGYIAGVLPNTEENLAYFIAQPHVAAPGTLMPDLDVSDSHARQMAAYLMSL
jgi:mono/diheme cytochrome c family protein/cytochrome c551/c552